MNQRVLAGLIGCLVLLRLPAVAQEAPTAENTELADLLASARMYEIRTTKPDAPLKLREPPQPGGDQEGLQQFLSLAGQKKFQI